MLSLEPCTGLPSPLLMEVMVGPQVSGSPYGMTGVTETPPP